MLTGTRAMAMLEKTCPAIWNRLIINVPWNMLLVGFLMPHPAVVLRLPLLPVRPGAGACIMPLCSLAARQTTQYPATNANWAKVSVTGYRNRVRIVLPVLDENAEDMYHRMQSRMKPRSNGAAAADELVSDCFESALAAPDACWVASACGRLLTDDFAWSNSLVRKLESGVSCCEWNGLGDLGR